MMRFGSVCSGIEAASIAWMPFGWEAAWFAEVDRAASEVLAYRFPHITNHGDMTKLAAMVLAGEIEAPDILVGGTPCQAFSVAGRREGLADERGQLTLAFVDLANAIDRVRRLAGKEPCIIVWENVPGVLSDRTGAFSCFLAGIVGDDRPVEPGPRPERGRSSAHWTWDKAAGEHRTKWTDAGYVAGPERAAAWRIQDAQYHGLAQRRRRVFVVASARQDIDPAAILLEFDGVRRDSAPSREAGEGITNPVAPCLTGSGRGVERTGDPRGQDAVVATQRPAGVAFGGGNTSGPLDVSTALNANERYDFDSETFVLDPHPVTVVHGTQDPCTSNHTAFALGRNNGAENAIAYAFQPRIARNGRGDMGAVVNALTAQAGETGKGDAAPCVAYAIQERAVCENPAAGPDGVGVRSDDCAYTLEARSVPQAVCVTGDITHCLKADGFDASEDGTGRGQPIVPWRNDNADAVGTDTAEALCVLREEVGEEAFTEWGAGVLTTLRSPEVLQSRLHGVGLRQATDNGDILGDNSLSFPQDGSAGAVLQVWNAGCDGCPPQGWQPSERVALQLGAHLSELPQSGASRITFLHAMRQAAQGIGLLLDALAAFQATWRSDDYEDQPARVTMAVRRLLPEECEALQGFPPGWTLVPIGPKRKPAADGPRYKQCGNSMATNVMNWIGRRIKAALPGDNGWPVLDDFADLIG